MMSITQLNQSFYIAKSVTLLGFGLIIQVSVKIEQVRKSGTSQKTVHFELPISRYCNTSVQAAQDYLAMNSAFRDRPTHW